MLREKRLKFCNILAFWKDIRFRYNQIKTRKNSHIRNRKERTSHNSKEIIVI